LGAEVARRFDLAAFDRGDFFGHDRELVGIKIGFVQFVLIEGGKDLNFDDEMIVVN